MRNHNKENKDLGNLRHSCAHLLAAAVLELYPKAKLAIGPAIEIGFYYDIDFGKVKISEVDLPKIESKMHELVQDWNSFSGKNISVDSAKKLFKDNPYKLELIEEFSEQGKKLTTYQSGNFTDLCRGGHIENPKRELTHFKLLSIAGAYWRGSEKNKMLTRIYGTCFPSHKELSEHLRLVEVAKKNDHRKIGRELGLFATSDIVGPGLILWLPKGTIIKEELERFAKDTESKEGYLRISTPHITRERLYHLSGHLPYYKDDMYPPMKDEGGDYYLKPMNCPHSHMVYSAQKHSYREFPVRYAEFGSVYRYEASGELMGLLRVRGMTQNDAHIYCLEDQVVNELINVMNLHNYYYKLFGIKDYYIELALPDFDKKKDKYFDNPKGWEQSVKLLRKAAKKSKMDVVEKKGTAAFYGPKFDFDIKSATGREFGASTNQLDFGSGKRFKLTYTASDGGEKIVPYIIHRAPLGSDERFIGFLIEHFGGAFPVWLHPVQVIVLPITERNLGYANNVANSLKSEGIRVAVDDKNETLQAKIRDSQVEKIPYMLIVGDKEEKSKKVSVRLRTEDNLGLMNLGKIQRTINQKIETKELDLI